MQEQVLERSRGVQQLQEQGTVAGACSGAFSGALLELGVAATAGSVALEKPGTCAGAGSGALQKRGSAAGSGSGALRVHVLERRRSPEHVQDSWAHV